MQLNLQILIRKYKYQLETVYSGVSKDFELYVNKKQFFSNTESVFENFYSKLFMIKIVNFYRGLTVLIILYFITFLLLTFFIY